MQRALRHRSTDEFKAQAIVRGESIGPAKAARQLDMSVKTLENWLLAARAGKPLSSPGRGRSYCSVPYTCSARTWTSVCG